MLATAGNKRITDAEQNAIKIAACNAKHLNAGTGIIAAAKNAQIFPNEVRRILDPICFKHSPVLFCLIQQNYY